MANLLFLTQRIPYPPTKGEKIRSLEILKHLSRTFDIHLGCLIDDAADWQHVDTVRTVCRDAYFAPLNPKRVKIACLRGLLTKEPFSVTWFRDAGLARWIDGVLNDVRPDVIFVCSSNMAPYILDRRNREGLCLVDLIDVDSEKWRALAETAKEPMRWVYRRECRLVAELERRIAQECHASTFASKAEAELFKKFVPRYATKIHSVSNGVNHDYFDPGQQLPSPYNGAKPVFVFTGTMDYRPNIDAVVWFGREIFPLIRRSLPDAQFYIVGSNPAHSVQRLTKVDGIQVTGRVPDVRPYLLHATAAVAPLRIARGIQNKVLEAMALAKPVIVTPAALTGIEAKPGREVVLAADAEEFATAACRMASGEGVREIGNAARRLILSVYAWDDQLRGFDALLANGAAAIEPGLSSISEVPRRDQKRSEAST